MGVDGVPTRPLWRIVAVSALRAVLTASVLVALYYLLPLDRGANTSTVAELPVGVLVFLALMAWQVRVIVRSDHPEVRGLEVLFVALPVFILLFALTYFQMSRADPTDFTSLLSRTDSLYFTVTILATVGFGDISARAEPARLVVTAQMILDLIILGLGVKVILGAVHRGQARSTAQTSSSPSSN